ncbi:unnamed protein product [Owenia fusiformis]|uniref:Uncharacterized protein n=1 Tax=Owenia fusiformis TaxID=6347 RepID=A0A8J1XRI1_OWEFU|nr:unnamed protein product [Owenia fusiformis]
MKGLMIIFAWLAAISADELCTKDAVVRFSRELSKMKEEIISACKGEDMITDCNDVPFYTGVKTIKTEEGRIFSVYCEQGWTYIFKRFDGSVNFYLPWADYKKGFGKTNCEHFIGLDNLASLVKQRGYKARIDLATWPETNTNPSKGYAEYTTFKVANESDKYRLTIGGYSGTVQDSMAWQNNMRFTTYDQDNDIWGPGNCGTRYKGAWWDSKCHNSNLFGDYNFKPQCTFAQCITWKNWPQSLVPGKDNYYYSFKEASMKICHKH